MNMMQTIPGRVTRRHAFFIAGYDPRGARFYHKLYKDEAAKQNRVNGLNIDVGPRKRGSEFESRWQVTASDDSGTIETTYHFLGWDDLVRARWPRSIFGVYADIWRWFWPLLLNGVYRHMLVISWPIFITFMYPVAFMVGHVLLAAVVGSLAGFFASWLLGPWAGIVAGLAAAASLFTFGSRLDEKFNALWLGRIGRFFADQGRGAIPDVDRRCEAFAHIIAASAGEEGCDEILLLGHSIGSHLALSTLARCLDLDPGFTAAGPAVSLLTLGHTIPTVTIQKWAEGLRRDLRIVAVERAISWIDMSSPIDGASLPLTDPVAASRLTQPYADEPRPKLLSPRFHALFTPQGYAEVKRNFKRAHLQYMMASELPWRRSS